MTEQYTPTEDEIVMGKTHLGDNFWRELTEAEVRRGISQVRAETLRKAREAINTVRNVPSLITLADKFGGYHQGQRSGLEMAEGIIARIEKEAGQ